MKPIPTLLLLALAALSASCAHKAIECPAAPAGIEIRFEWDRAPAADVDGMSLYFYPLDSYSRLWRFDIAGRDGGRVELPSGTYRLIACNNDLLGTTIAGADALSTVRAEAARTVADGVYTSTGMLYGAVVSELEVTPCGVSYTTPEGTVKHCGRGLVRCHPDSLATHYSVRVSHVSGMEHARSVAADVSPTASAVMLDTQRPAGRADASLRMTLAADRQQHTLTGEGCAFGAPPLPSACRLSLLVATTEGKTVARSVEITPQELNIISPHNVMITIDGLDLPDDGSGAGDVGGIDAIVDGWSVVEINLSTAMQ